jgi:hypothetical protein
MAKWSYAMTSTPMYTPENALSKCTPPQETMVYTFGGTFINLFT